MLKSSAPEEGVSPVIGTILMVAITVILAAMIATIVLGMATNIPVTRSIVATVSQVDADSIVIVYKGGPDEALFRGANVTITASDSTVLPRSAYSPGDPGTENRGYLPFYVGSTCTAVYTTGSTLVGKDHVVVTAWFNDGSQQVILNTFI